LATYALFMLHGREALIEAMAQADTRGIYGVEYLEVLLTTAAAETLRHPCLSIDLPTQDAVDRRLDQYEAFVTVSAGGAAW